MAKKFNPDGKLSPEELAKHLRQPQGETGKQVGLHMNKGNKHICMNSYKVLAPDKGNRILEIGMGNGFYIKDLLAISEGLTYVGVDFSNTMVVEASSLNKALIETKKVEFVEGSIADLPFEDNSFDCITTTNTLYFWPEPSNNAKELLRVLKPGGKLLLAYRSKSCMDQIKVSGYGFTTYFPEDVQKLLSEAGFINISTQSITEPELEFDGKAFAMEGFYTVGMK